MVSGNGHMPLLVSSGYSLWNLYSLVSLVYVWVVSIVVCLCVRLAKASGSGVLLSVGLYIVVSFCRWAFVSVVINRPSGALRRISPWFVGCWVISYVAVGAASRSGFMDVVENVVCLGCQTRGCCLGAGEAVRAFSCVGALLAW